MGLCCQCAYFGIGETVLIDGGVRIISITSSRPNSVFADYVATSLFVLVRTGVNLIRLFHHVSTIGRPLRHLAMSNGTDEPQLTTMELYLKASID